MGIHSEHCFHGEHYTCPLIYSLHAAWKKNNTRILTIKQTRISRDITSNSDRGRL